MKNNGFEQEPKLNIDDQIDSQKETFEKGEASREHELKKWEELEKLEDEYVKLQLECDEKWDLMVAADNEEWAMIEKMLSEIDELCKKTEDPIKKGEIEDEVWDKYESSIDDLHEKNKIAWQVWKEVSEKLEEKWEEREAIANQLFKKETNQS